MVKTVRNSFTQKIGISMIIGLGIDLTNIARIQTVYEKYGLRFLKHIFSEREMRATLQLSSERIAGHFAAKEAAAKALGTGFSMGMTPKQIEIINDAKGKPELCLSGAALFLANRIGARSFHLSISHERRHAIAIVILEG